MGEEQVLDMDVWREVYSMGTSAAYSFLYINNQKPARERYFIRFEERLIIDEVHIDEEKENMMEYKEEDNGARGIGGETGAAGAEASG